MWYRYGTCRIWQDATIMVLFKHWQPNFLLADTKVSLVSFFPKIAKTVISLLWSSVHYFFLFHIDMVPYIGTGMVLYCTDTVSLRVLTWTWRRDSSYWRRRRASSASRAPTGTICSPNNRLKFLEEYLPSHPKSGLWIRNDLNADPAFVLIADPDPDPGLWWPKILKK